MIFTSGLSSPEGPVLLNDGSWLVVEMGPDRGSITQISREGQTKRTIAKTGRPNGLALDCRGTIWVAESGSQNPALLRLSMEGEVDVFLTSCGNTPFLFPNDLCFGPDGALYLTDSGILHKDVEVDGAIRTDFRSLKPDGRIYRIDRLTKQTDILDCGLCFANGIAFDGDRNLYVSETFTGRIYRYPYQNKREYGSRDEFANVLDMNADTHSFAGPDGMAFDQQGKLYVAVSGQGNITVLDSDGSLETRIRTQGKLPTNVAFGPTGSRQIMVTECEKGSMEMFDVEADGLPLYKG